MFKPEWLPDLILLESFQGNWERYLNYIYCCFKDDFIKNSPKFNGEKLKVKRHPLVDNREATFWHIISEGKVEKDRTVDFRRCERIKWPASIINNHLYSELKIWKNKRRNEKRICIWFEKIEYLVVLAERSNYILFWTAYPVTQSHRKKKLQKEYMNYKRLTPPESDGVVTPSTHGR